MYFLRCCIIHVCGPRKIVYEENEFVVLCLVRNGEEYIDTFIRHYLSLGAEHIVFLDNGSTDRTVSIAQQYPKITILKTHLPYKKYNLLMKRYLLIPFCKKPLGPSS